MQSTKKVLLGLVLLAALGTASTAHAQKVNKSTLSGTLASASVAVPDDGAAHTVFTTPAVGTPQTVFVLTQFCATAPGPGSVTLSGSTFGQVVVDTADSCTTFNPGITFKPAETLSCVNGTLGSPGSGTGSTEQCMVTGILTK